MDNSGDFELSFIVKQWFASNGKDERGIQILRRLKRQHARIDHGKRNVNRVIKSFVQGVVRRAKRTNLWRRVDPTGIKFLELVVKMPVTFRSKILLRALFKTLKELLSFFNPLFRHYVAGYETARNISEIAHKWGVKDALNWLKDKNFAICWGMFVSSSPYRV